MIVSILIWLINHIILLTVIPHPQDPSALQRISYDLSIEHIATIVWKSIAIIAKTGLSFALSIVAIAGLSRALPIVAIISIAGLSLTLSIVAIARLSRTLPIVSITRLSRPLSIVSIAISRLSLTLP